MTIAAGLLCTDGIILCADSHDTDDEAKYQADKIFSFDDLLLVTGAGDTAYIRMTFDKLSDDFKTPAVNRSDARDKVETVVKDVFAEHIFQFPSGKPDFELIVAAKCADGSLALIKTVKTAAYLSTAHESTGLGQPMFRYWAGYLYRNNLDMDAMSYLAFFMLSEVKKHSENCGGWSLLYKLPLSNTYKYPRMERILYDAGIMVNFPESMTRILAAIANFQTDDRWVKDKLEEFSKYVMETREAIRKAKEGRDKIK